MRLNSLLALPLLSLLLLGTSSATWAHKVIFDVYPSGSVIEGELGFSNGDMAPEQLILVQTEAGVELAQIYTDSDGFFAYTPSQKMAMIFVADLGSGHVAKASVALEDLVDGHSDDGGSNVAMSTSTGNAKPVAVTQTEVKPVQLAMPKANATQASVAQELSKLTSELKQMRRELKAYKEKHNLQTVLGGIGYILGLVGLAYYFAARRKLQDH